MEKNETLEAVSSGPIYRVITAVECVLMVLVTGWMLLGQVITQSLPEAETVILVAQMAFLLLSFRLLPEKCPMELRLMQQSAMWLFAAQALTNRLGWGIYNPLSMMLLTLGAAALGLRIRWEQMKQALHVMVLVWCGILAVGSLCGILAAFAGQDIPGAVLESSGLIVLGHGGKAFACCLATGAGLLLRQCACQRGWLWKVMAVICLPLYGIALLLENSKAAFLAVAVMLSLVLAELLQRPMRDKLNNIPRIVLTLLAAVVFFVCASVALCFGGNQLSGVAATDAAPTTRYQAEVSDAEELTEAKSASQTANKPATEAETVTEVATEAAAETVTEAVTETAAETVTEAVTESAADTDAQTMETVGTLETAQTEEAMPAIAGVSQQEEDDFETELSQSRWNWYDIVDELRDYPQGLLFGLAEFSEEVPVHDQLLYFFWQGGVPLLVMMVAVLLMLLWRMVKVFFMADPELSRRVRFTVVPLAGLLVLVCTMPLMEEAFSFAWAVFALVLGWFIQASEDWDVTLPKFVKPVAVRSYSPQRLVAQMSDTFQSDMSYNPQRLHTGGVPADTDVEEEPADDQEDAEVSQETETDETDVQEQEADEARQPAEEGTEP